MIRVGKEGIVRRTGKDMAELRHECFVDADGICYDCGCSLVEFPQSMMQSNAYHMAHVRNKRMYGDQLSNVLAKCHDCHMIWEHRGGKVVPAK